MVGGALVAGGLVGAALLDSDVQRHAQENRTDSRDDLAETFRHFGQPEIFGTVTLGMVGGGLVSNNPELTRAGAGWRRRCSWRAPSQPQPNS